MMLLRWMFTVPGIVVASVLVACGEPSGVSAQDTGNAVNKVVAQARIVVRDNALVYEGEKTHILLRSDTAIEALAAVKPWLLWSEDDLPGIKLGRLSADGESLEAVTLSTIEHDAELLCMAQREAGIYDLFVHDGDAFFYHYWLLAEEKSLRPVRRIATNPEVDACALTGDTLVFHDPYIGALTLERDPETDSILRRASDAQVETLAGQPADAVIFGQTVASVIATTPTVTPVLETRPVADSGDAADDPVVLAAGNHTWIVGTNKQRGLAVYDLAGEQRHFSPRGRLNNVDAVGLDEGAFLLAGSNRTHKTIDLFRAQPQQDQFAFTASLSLDMEDPYGLCMSDGPDGVAVFVNDSDGVLEHWQLNAAQDGGRRVARYRFDSQTEGCVVDAANNHLYIGEEGVGIWRMDIASGERDLLASIEDGMLVADVEGLDIYHGRSARYLVASSQGDNSYVVYTMEPWTPLGKFRIVADIRAGIDGASETDGLALSAEAMPGFPAGILVVQDGRNRAPQQPQNFKVVDWRTIEALIEQWQKQQ